MARNRRRLPAGWSHAIKPGEVKEVFPGVGHVTWNGRPANWRDSEKAGEWVVFWLDWNVRSALPQPVLTVWAVPSGQRSVIRGWIDQVVRPEAREWLSGLGTRSPVWRDAQQSVWWRWPA